MEQFSLEKYLQDPTRKVITRDGQPVRIICTNLKGNKPIVACITCYDPQYEVARTYYKDGKGTYGAEKDDLFFAPTKHSRWVFLYYNEAQHVSSSMIYNTKATAEKELKRLKVLLLQKSLGRNNDEIEI